MRPLHHKDRDPDGYYAARKEHAWLLRCEGLTFDEIGKHVGTGRARALQMVATFSRYMRSGTRRCRFRWEQQP